MNPNTITKHEYCDPKRAKWVLENHDKISYRICSDYRYDPIQQLTSFCKNVLKSVDNSVQTTYKRPLGANSGRFYAHQNGNKTNGYQTLPREFRDTLSNRDYYDLDMVNCQPNLLEQYCNKNVIVCRALSKYNKSRDFIIEGMMKKYDMTRDDIKQAFLSVVFGGRIHEKLNDSETMLDFHCQMQEIHKKIMDLNKNVVAFVKRKKTTNIGGSVCSHVLQAIEHNVMISGDGFLIKNGFQSDVLIFDGMMVRKTKEINAHVLYEMAKYIEGETEYKTKWIVKAMDQGYNITDEELDSLDTTDLNYILIEDDHTAAQMVVAELKKTKKIVKVWKDDEQKETYYINKFGGIYQEDRSASKTATKSILKEIIAKMNFKKKDKDGNVCPYSKNNMGNNNIIDFSKSGMEMRTDFVEKLWWSNIGKLCWENGYLEVSSGKWTDWEDCDGSVLSTIYIHGNHYNDCDSVGELYESIKWIEKNILEAIFIDKKQREDWKHWIARAIAGEWEDKTWLIATGARNCGKGVLTQILKKAFGNYVKLFNAECFFVSKISDDPAKKLGWMIPFQYSRLYISNECKTEDQDGKKLKMCGEMIKTGSSGGDEIAARKLHEDEKGMQLQGKLWFNMNEIPKVSPENACETLVCFNFLTEFEAELTPQHEFLNKCYANNEDGEYDYKYQKADPKIKQKVTGDNMLIAAFTHIILSSYLDTPFVPSSTSKDNAESIFTSDEALIEILTNLYDFKLDILFDNNTPNDSWKQHWILVKDVCTQITEYNNDNAKKISFSQVTKVFKKKGVIKYKLTTKDSKEHFSKWAWRGISLKPLLDHV